MPCRVRALAISRITCQATGHCARWRTDPKETPMRFMRVQTPDLEWYKNNVPCQVACPAKTDIPRYISLIAQHRYRESYEVNCGSNLFPDILGRVCSHPCETVCRRKKIDGKPIAIRDL